jgi:hypothetical protein
MTKKELNGLYGEVVDQIQTHLGRGSIEDAQERHEAYCKQMLGLVPQMEKVDFVLKDIVLAFADKLDFPTRNPALEQLRMGTSASMLTVLREARCVKVSPEVQGEWKHLAANDPESAVAIVAIGYRLFTERKLKKLVRAQKRLAQEFKSETSTDTSEDI